MADSQLVLFPGRRLKICFIEDQNVTRIAVHGNLYLTITEQHVFFALTEDIIKRDLSFINAAVIQMDMAIINRCCRSHYYRRYISMRSVNGCRI